MKRLLLIAAGAFVLGAAGLLSAPAISLLDAKAAPAQAVEVQTVTFSVENMTCALCPVTVKKAMEGVAGVKSVTVDFDAKTATAVFDPSVTNADAIAAASTNAGYPAAARS